MLQNKFKAAIEEIHDPAEPIDIFRSLRHRPYSFFLDSACDPKKLGRYSFIGCDPFLMFISKRDSVILKWADGKIEEFKSDPFLALKKLLKRYEAVNILKETPFAGGAVGYFSYDLKSFIEELPDSAKDDMGVPDCILGFYDSVVTYDHLNKRCYLSRLGISDGAYKELKGLINSAGRNAAGRDSNGDIIGSSPFQTEDCALKSNYSKNSYMAAVEKAKAYIKKGDIYQVNISQRFHATLFGDSFDLYLRLRGCSPAPFASYLNFNDVTILSSSPERFILKRGGRIETRPIKGTRPRGEDAIGDAALAAELKKSVKDMAEHIMIVDLERNDLGRICEYGSVGPTESAVIEKYANVFHMVSTVEGRLKKGVDPVDCLLATFPGGSITGAPKIRSMEIIDELEPVRRSVYTGAIGYIGFDGNMDTSIVIRTFVIKGKDIYFQVGGGIVADSIPEKEYEETLHKAAGLMQALGMGSRKEKVCL